MSSFGYPSNPNAGAGSMWQNMGQTLTDNWEMISGIAGFSMQTASLLGGANLQAQQSQLGVEHSDIELAALAKTEGKVPEVVQAQKDIAGREYNLAMAKTSQEGRQASTGLYLAEDEAQGMQKFAHSGAIDKELYLAKQGIEETQNLSRLFSQEEQQKSIGKAISWGEKQLADIHAQQRKVEAQKDFYKSTNTMWKALGFG
tara:strand:+ start:5125 stop:5727 length:603 start_codon:yes stop_codon:yes gene_type:complete